jgi:hypothetical protein
MDFRTWSACDWIGEMHDPDKKWRPREGYDGHNPKDPEKCGQRPENIGKNGAPASAGVAGESRPYIHSGVSVAPKCEQQADEMNEAGCPLVTPGSSTAQEFQRAANTDQLGMMVTQGLIAFQTNDTERAGRLSNWVLEVVPCSASDAAKGVQSEACEQRRQATAIQQYVAAGMASRGSSMVLTPRQSLQLLQV